MKYLLLTILFSISALTCLQTFGTSKKTYLSKQIQSSDSIKITRARADELLTKLPATDPWEARPDGSALAWGEAATGWNWQQLTRKCIMQSEKLI